MAAPFTPLDDRGELALHKIQDLAKLYRKNHIKGAFICGSTGEGPSLTHEEKKELIKFWAKERHEQLEMIFFLGGTSLKEITELGNLAQEYQLDGISICSPYYFKPSSLETLVSFCEQAASSAPQLPFYYYHIPAITGTNFKMADFLDKAHEVIPNLAGIKFTAPDLFDFQRCITFEQRRYNILWGTDEALLTGLSLGGIGAVGSTYNYAAPLYHRLIQTYEEGSMHEARSWQGKAVEMVNVLFKFGGIGAGKAFMKLIGIDCGWFRPPITTFPDYQLSQLKNELESIGFFEYCSVP